MTREELNKLRDECANLLLFEKECTCEFPDYGDCPYHDKNFDVNYGFDAAVDALWPVVEENQKLRAQVAGLSKTIRTAATYLRAVIPKDAENCDPEVQMLHSFEETLARIEVEPRNVWSGTHDELLEEIYGRCDHNAPITLIEWPNPVQEGGE